jgi:hypothetical protein
MSRSLQHLSMKTLLMSTILTLATASTASAFSLTPDQYIGNVRQYTNEVPPYLYISSGSNSRAIRSLNAFLDSRCPTGFRVQQPFLIRAWSL